MSDILISNLAIEAKAITLAWPGAVIACKATGADTLVEWSDTSPVPAKTAAEISAAYAAYVTADAKTKKIAAVQALLATKIAAGRLHNTKTYQIRPEDRENFLGVAVMLARAKLNPHAGAWRDLANTEVPLNDIEMGALIDSVYAYLRDLRRAATTHTVAIRALGTVALVNAYDITAGWPANS